jgi:hypothetical protein
LSNKLPVGRFCVVPHLFPFSVHQLAHIYVITSVLSCFKISGSEDRSRPAFVAISCSRQTAERGRGSGRALARQFCCRACPLKPCHAALGLRIFPWNCVRCSALCTIV